MAEKPTAAFVLSLIGGLIIVIGSLLSAIVFFLIGGGFLFVIPGVEWLGALMLILIVLPIIFGIIVLVGAMWINTAERGKVRNGSLIVLIFSIISLIFLAVGS